MKTFRPVAWLSWLIALLALLATAFGLLYPAEGSTFIFTPLRGEPVQIYGQGLYRFDTPIVALSFKGADIITLALAIPLLVLATLYYTRGRLRGGFLLAGVLAYFLYNYGGMAFGAAYNNLFLVYIALLSTSLFAFILALLSFDVPMLPYHFARGLTRRGIGIFLIVSGIILALIWLGLSILPALFRGRAPMEVASYTTFVTGVIDLAIITPALIVAGGLLLRKAPSGYLLASTMLVFTAILGPNLFTGSVLQLLAGAISVGQAMGFSVPFAILTVFAVYFTVVLFRNISDLPPMPPGG